LQASWPRSPGPAQALAEDTAQRRGHLPARVLRDDAAFIRRFRSEAQTAAGLNHSNLLAVYDWGEDDVPFLVTEFIGGGSGHAHQAVG
jgi:serine/threonine-protein kinase